MQNCGDILSENNTEYIKYARKFTSLEAIQVDDIWE